MEKQPSYRSYHTLSPREYMYFPKGTMDVSTPGQISQLEILHILIAMIVLTVSFTFALTQSSFLMMFLFHSATIPRFFMGLGVSFLGILSAFFVHEMSHKLMAQKYGLWSEFRMYPKGLLISLFLSICTGFVFAVPGAVMFRGEPRPFEEGHIAVAGPGANIVLAALTFPLLFISVSIMDNAFFFYTVGYICFINTVLGFFNILPFGPFDGVVIMRWNKKIWIVLFIIACLLVGMLIPFIPQLLI